VLTCCCRIAIIARSYSSQISGSVMNIKWDYNYYQLWSDNEWLVDKMIAMLDKNIIMH